MSTEIFEKLSRLADDVGFSHNGRLNTDAIIALPEVREMCADGKCKIYGTNWKCPPHCGTIEECEAKMKSFSDGIIVQTTMDLEDEFDGEGMMEAHEIHLKHFKQFVSEIREEYPDVLPLSAGTCTICAKCTCPDDPCRNPAKAMSSMEAFGLNISDVCRESGIPYYYGPCTMTYTSCVLFD